MFTYPQYSTLGTVAATMLGNLQVLLSYHISAGKYKRFPKRLRNCEDFPQTKRAYFLFHPAFCSILINVFLF